VQIGDVQAVTSEVGDNLSHVEAPAKWKKHRLLYGDVMFLGRGMRNDAATFVGKADDVIDAPHLFVLRANKLMVVSDYLTWFLNLPETQERIRSFRAGSAVPFVPMDALSQLEMPVPSLEMQNQVVGLHRLCRQEQRLLEQIGNRHRVLYDSLMRKAIQREIDE
jgi:hypothetical protein